jgi:hypothetical protein
MAGWPRGQHRVVDSGRGVGIQPQLQRQQELPWLFATLHTVVVAIASSPSSPSAATRRDEARRIPRRA